MADTTLTKDQFSAGDPVTYWYGSRKVHALVVAMSKSGQRAKIKWPAGYSSYHLVYVKPENLERGHV